jgi:putative endonuclease
LDGAAESVTDRQKLRIAAAAEAWLAAHPGDPMHDVRFDAVLVAPGSIPRHIAAAFEAPSF